MAKKTFCPRCGSKKMKMHTPQTSIWECAKCGYIGSVAVEDGNIEKNIEEIKKMEKLSKKLLWRR